VIDAALRKANIQKNSYQQLPSRKVLAHGFIAGGSSFAKSIALALKIPLIVVNHMQRMF
jgi:N6-L-threonylcarbamoyladenine synthase